MAMAPDAALTPSISLHPDAFPVQAHLARTSSPGQTTSTEERATSSSYELSVLETEAGGSVARRPDLGLHLTPDLEEQRQARYTKENDPYRLSAGLKTATEMKGIELSAGDGRFPIAIVGPGRRKARKIQEFYYSQNANIERLLKPVDEHRSQARDDHSGNQVKYKIAVHGSFVANVILAGLQVFAAASSGSLSLFTTMADAIFDPLSNLTLILSHRAVNSVDARKFPSGKARIETAGNIVFCFIMCSMSFIIIVLAARELMAGSKHETREFHPGSVAAVAIALVTKMVLFAYCWTLRNTYSQIRILWQDHRNDIFVNAFGLMTSVGGSKLRWWIDPTGAIVLSCVVALIWLRTAYSEFQLLIGVTASLELQQLITYISVTHSPLISQIDTVRAYYSGPRIIVEVDVVMDPDATLRATHDVAEELQSKLESLPDVERAYAHVDYETSHKPEHFLKKEL